MHKEIMIWDLPFGVNAKMQTFNKEWEQCSSNKLHAIPVD